MRRNKNFQRLEAGNDKGYSLIVSRNQKGYHIFTYKPEIGVKVIALHSSWGAIKNQYDLLLNHPEVWEHLESV